MLRMLILSVILLTPASIWAEEPKTNSNSKSTHFEVETIKNLAYRTDSDADPVKHKLDLYLPKKQKDFPMLMFVHGGSWRSGNKELYGVLGALFARNGIGTAVINYRLTTGEKPAKHPDHINDVVKAFAWLHANVGKYGSKVDRLFLAGHSAGGHLVSLLATDESYLKAEKLSFKDIRGVMPLSGVYTIESRVSVFHGPFGKEEDICKKASPIQHVGKNHPPFLIAYADQDLPTLDKMAEDFSKKLKESKCEANVLKITDRNHITIIMKLAASENDPCTAAMIEFIQKKMK